jgi:tRNA(Ile)-lysidine synthetase, N-terminal domain
MNFFTKTEKDILLAADQVVVGFSGGPDSTLALHQTLHLLNEFNSANKLKALHINHQVQSKSDAWEEHCKSFCADKNIDLQIEKIEIEVKGEGFEAAARKARLSLFNSFNENTVLILGHHLDDQIETVLFRIFRGTGMKGLSGIKRQSKLGTKIVLRPLFNLTKEEIMGIFKKRKI